MEILATFDGSKCSEAVVPELEWMAGVPGAHFTLLSIVRAPHETVRLTQPSQAVVVSGLNSTPVALPDWEPTFVEDRGEAIERTLAERSQYLRDIVSQMPPGSSYHVETMIADDVAAAIVRYAMEHAPDVIVMGTHGESHMIHRLFGDTAEAVVRSGVAPVLLVHSETRRQAKNSRR